nr:MAG TPA: tail tape measure [Caudoviricetes sp.]
MAIASMYDMQQSINADIDTRSIEEARHEINQATSAIHAMNEALNNQTAPDILPSIGDGWNKEPVSTTTAPRLPEIWRTDNLDTFTDTGIERFQQEVQSAHNMLNTLNETQERIVQTASGMDILPDEAVLDMDVMQQRLRSIQQSIQQIESNPLNVGSDRTNAELEQLRSQLNTAINEQNELNQAIQNMDVASANSAYLRLSQTVSRTERYIRDNADEQEYFNQRMSEGVSHSNHLLQKVTGIVGAYATLHTMGNIIGLSDTMTQTNARLSLIVDDGGSVEELQNKIYASAQNARGSYLTTADAVSKLGMQASQAFNSNDELIGFTELLNKSFVNAGTSAQGIDSVMLQLTQSMAAGKLQGEELNAVLDNAAPIVQNIQQYMEEVQGIDASNIKELASEGIITADVIKNSMFYAADEINAKFESMPMTWGQIWQSAQNTAMMAFQPVLQRLNDMANSEAFQTFLDRAITGMATLANIVLNVFDLMGAAGSFVADNWSIISPIVYGVVAALAVYATYLGIIKALELASAAASAVMAVGKGLYAAATVLATGATWAHTTAQLGLNGAMYACPIVWIIMLIIALIAIFYMAVGAINKFAGTSVSATGLIAGAFAMLAASVVNIFVVPTWNAIASLVNFIGNVFNDPIAAIKVLFYDMCLTVIGYIANLAHAIEDLLNKIPGVTVDITSGLDSFYSGLEQAQQAVKDESGWVEYMGRMDYVDYSEWGNAGYDFGAGVEDSIKNFSFSDLFGMTDIPDPSEYTTSAYQSGFQDTIGDNIGSIAGDTGAIKDSMDITEEELKYLRDAAEQEAVNRFTTAEISVDMSGMQNTVNSGDDLDGFMSRLTDSVNEAVDSMTEGVHE